MNALDRVGTIHDFYDAIKGKQGRDRWFYAKRLNLTHLEINQFADQLIGEGKIYEHPVSGGCYIKEAAPVVEEKAAPVVEEKAAPVVEEKAATEESLHRIGTTDKLARRKQKEEQFLLYLSEHPATVPSVIARHFGYKVVSALSQTARTLRNTGKVKADLMGVYYLTADAKPCAELTFNRNGIKPAFLASLNRILLNGYLDEPRSICEIRQRVYNNGIVMSEAQVNQYLGSLIERDRIHFSDGAYISLVRLPIATVRIRLADILPITREAASTKLRVSLKTIDVAVTGHFKIVDGIIKPPVDVDEPSAAAQATEEKAEKPTSVEPPVESGVNPYWVSTLEAMAMCAPNNLARTLNEIIDYLKKPT